MTMLRLFKRIKKRLLVEGNLKKYLLYAIGEILLIVLGILLALKVSNMKESKENKLLQFEYLKEIKTELQNNIRLMDKLVLSRFDRKMEGLNKAKIFATDNYTVIDTIGFLNDVSYGAVFSNGIEFLSSRVYEELKNTGNFHLIQNDSLKAYISGYYHFIDKQLINTRYYVSDYHTYINALRPFDRNKPDSISINDQKFMLSKLKSEETIKYANSELTYGQQVYYIISGLYSHTGELIEFIEQELNKQ